LVEILKKKVLLGTKFRDFGGLKIGIRGKDDTSLKGYTIYSLWSVGLLSLDSDIFSLQHNESNGQSIILIKSSWVLQLIDLQLVSIWLIFSVFLGKINLRCYELKR
jgi:hypothetical protein